MLLFLAGIVEQLDLALEHIGKGDEHNARFGLMMTDNALELVLHRIVKDRRQEAASWRFRDKPYPHETALKKAFLGSFSEKISFAQIDSGMVPEVGRTFNTMHAYRNELYHAGLAHEAILRSLALFYFTISCEFISQYRPASISWGSGQKMPERAQKYFKGDEYFRGRSEDFSEACKTMAAASGHDAETLINVLADDVNEIIDYMDTCIQIVADGVYVDQKVTRDQAVLSTQAWDLAFDDEGRAFLEKEGFKGNMLKAATFLEEKYPFRFRRDPIPSWQASAKRLRRSKSPFQALDRYQAFITHTGPLRASIEQSAAAAEAEMEAASDRARGR